jgi:hypothetical protein
MNAGQKNGKDHRHIAGDQNRRQTRGKVARSIGRRTNSPQPSLTCVAGATRNYLSEVVRIPPHIVHGLGTFDLLIPT